MTQTLHIFAKDARRFWPEIVSTLALLAAFAYVQPLAVAGQTHRDASSVLYAILQPILYVLIPISWWVLVSRVIHEENLVGDRQFWITRPYRWPSLLAAKLLLLAVFVLLPVALLQAVILFESGFHPVHLLAGILFSVALLGVTVILPLAAFSTITTSFARLTVTMLGIFISVLVFVSLLVPHTRDFGVTPHPELPYIFITFAACAAIVLLQYARRRTFIARVVLTATIVLLILIPVFFSTSLMGIYFPASASPTPDSFAIKLDAVQSPWISGLMDNNHVESQTVTVPIVISGVAPDSLVEIEAIKVTLTSASGLRYVGPWRNPGQAPHLPGPNEGLPIVLPRAFLDKVKSSPVSISLSLGVTQLTSRGTSAMPFPTAGTETPGFGLCSGTVRIAGNQDNSSYFLSCTTALRAPDYTYVTARWSDIPCNRPQPSADQLVAGDVFTGSFDADPASVGLSPLVSQQINFSNGVVNLPNNATRQRYLCAGTPLTFTRYTLTRRFGTKLNIPNLNLAALPSTPIGDRSRQPAMPAGGPNE